MNARRSITLCCCLIVGQLAGGAAAVLAQAGQLHWRKSTPLPEARGGYAAGVLDEKLVIACGTFWEGEPGNWKKKLFSTSTHAFDPDCEVWEQLPPAPIPLGDPAHTVVNNRLYVLGGYNGSEESDKILSLQRDGSRYVWKTVGKLPEPRVFAWACSVGSSIYLLGGTRQFEQFDEAGTCCTSATVTNDLMVWDTAAPAAGWRKLAPHPGGKRWLFAAATDGESIWMFGGTHQEKQQDPVILYLDAFRYRIDQGTWEKLPSLPPATREAMPISAVRIADKILLASFAKTVWQFDVTSREYTITTPLPEEAIVDKFVWINDRLVGSGGETKLDRPRRRSDWTFLGEYPGDK